MNCTECNWPVYLEREPGQTEQQAAEILFTDIAEVLADEGDIPGADDATDLFGCFVSRVDSAAAAVLFTDAGWKVAAVEMVRVTEADADFLEPMGYDIWGDPPVYTDVEQVPAWWARGRTSQWWMADCRCADLPVPDLSGVVRAKRWSTARRCSVRTMPLPGNWSVSAWDDGDLARPIAASLNADGTLTALYDQPPTVTAQWHFRPPSGQGYECWRCIRVNHRTVPATTTWRRSS